jgi:signal transduction histidine kinase
MMFRRLRIRLTLLYLAAVLALMGTVAAGSYFLVRYYFQANTDLALQQRMAEEFGVRGLSLPDELFAAILDWAGKTGRPVPRGFIFVDPRAVDSDDTTPETTDASSHIDDPDEVHDAELAAIFALPLDAQGNLLPGTSVGSLTPHLDAVLDAQANGSDLRTVRTKDGIRVRLLTYRLPSGTDTAFIQAGRLLSDQDRVLMQLLIGILILSGVGAVAVGGVSWWLAGRSLAPLRGAWEQQQSFVANAGHELRTPLTLIRASAEVARRRTMTPAAVDASDELLADIIQECDHMGHLVEDLVLLSRLDSGRLVLARTRVEVGVLLSELARQFGRVAEEAGVGIELHEITGVAMADPTRLRQVILILLDNAVRHTPPGGTVFIGSHQSGRTVIIEVRDTGIGIEEEHLDRVFERFYQVDDARSGEARGNGLGLSIAQALLAAQDGTIRLESTPGIGTRALVHVPRARD